MIACAMGAGVCRPAGACGRTTRAVAPPASPGTSVPRPSVSVVGTLPARTWVSEIHLILASTCSWPYRRDGRGRGLRAYDRCNERTVRAIHDCHTATANFVHGCARFVACLVRSTVLIILAVKNCSVPNFEELNCAEADTVDARNDVEGGPSAAAVAVEAAAAARRDRPVDRHVGHWTTGPARCPSSMVTDGP